jgi:hypothetical protein
LGKPPPGDPCTGEDDTVDSIDGRNAAEDADAATVDDELAAIDVGLAAADAAAGSDPTSRP